MEYRPMWQTWELVRPIVTREDARPEGPRPVARPDDLRLTVQRARIERRWSVSTLASQCECDVETLAAFERGDEVIHPNIQARLKSVLKI